MTVTTTLGANVRPPWIRLVGPACAVSIGYVDPGNWATDLAAGKYGFRLLWVVFLSNAIAIVLQLAVSRVTTDSGVDLATAIAARWPRLSLGFGAVFAAAAMATDLAEFGGIVLGIELLSRASVALSVTAGLAVVAAALALTDRIAKGFERILIFAIVVISAACLYQVPLLHPDVPALMAGAVIPRVPDAGALTLVVGIIGATVMPHNLFLHSSLLMENYRGRTGEERARRNRFFARETIVALSVAALANAGLLVVGAALRGARGSIEDAYRALAPVGHFAGYLFGGALLVSGVAATMTATVAGDYIFAAFSPIRVASPVRRAITVVPAAVVIARGVPIGNLLVWSQVALALMLPAVLIPLLLLMRHARKNAPHCRFDGLLWLASLTSAACVGFDIAMISENL